MKKVVLIAVLFVFCLSAVFTFVACNDGEQLQIYVPDGAPALAVAKLIDDGKIGGFKANVTISTGEDVTTKCESGQADIALLPTNAAVKICSGRSEYKLFTTNVWGLLYVIGWNQISSLNELNGKTVSSIGLGQTGEHLFKRILDANGVSYADYGVILKYVVDATAAIGNLMQNKCDYALVGEPAATNAINNAKANGKTLYRVFDLQTLWQNVTGSDVSGYPQAGVIVKKSLLEQQGFADALYNALAGNSVFLTDNVDRITDVLKTAGSLTAVNYNAEIISKCNIKVVKACEIKQEIYDYLEQLGKQFAQILKDDLYYEFNG